MSLDPGNINYTISLNRFYQFVKVIQALETYFSILQTYGRESSAMLVQKVNLKHQKVVIAGTPKVVFL